jgi:hypothetical protein
MHDILRNTGKPIERSRIVEVCNDWHNAESTQLLMVMFGSRKRINTPATAHGSCKALTNVATTND